MRAVVYPGPFDIGVQEVPDPRIEHPNDVSVRITSTCICGSDLHVYEGRTCAGPSMALGHENLGTVEDVDSSVTRLDQGDRVVIGYHACELAGVSAGDDPVQQIKDETGGEGTDRGTDAVGYQAVGPPGAREDPATVLNRTRHPARTGSSTNGSRATPRSPSNPHSPEARRKFAKEVVGKENRTRRWNR
jgi:hypothetical protein